MKNKIDLEDVYLEYPESLEDEEEEKVREVQEEITSTTKLSLEELQKRLEETQSLRL
ncbi:MAG: hypothetical protein J5982_02640 [Bacilli bacterium]|nr:hypothetical protein [Bacilli bacterium]